MSEMFKNFMDKLKCLSGYTMIDKDVHGKLLWSGRCLRMEDVVRIAEELEQEYLNKLYIRNNLAVNHCSVYNKEDIGFIKHGTYRKAIDDFLKSEDYLMEKIKEEKIDMNIEYEWRKVVCLDDIRKMLHEGMLETAEKLKECEENGQF